DYYCQVYDGSANNWVF
nr:immunoglobulin light chain junction region [Macaca mulatta]MOW60794.1 immunoglobulin light chain junction region [Macaca mulatta]